MGSEDQALIVQSKKSRTYHHRGKHSLQKNNNIKSNKYFSKFIFYTCDERGHLARDCPRSKYRSHNRKGNKKRHHALMLQNMMSLLRRESNKKVMILEVMKNMF